MFAPASAPAPLLEATSLEVGYDGSAILPALDLSIEAGQFWCLFGRNGAGKTTLMRTLLRLLPAVKGTVTQRPAARVGYVPQRTELDLSVPSRVIDLVRTGLDSSWSFLRPLPTVEQKLALAAALVKAQVQDLAREPFRDLSEGQKQRVLLARALVTSPELLVLDEPTSAMDHENESLVFEMLADLCEQGVGVLIITHDVERAANLATHAIFVDKDLDQAVAGAIDEVFHHRGFIRQYGAVFAIRAEHDAEVEIQESEAEEHF